MCSFLVANDGMSYPILQSRTNRRGGITIKGCAKTPEVGETYRPERGRPFEIGSVERKEDGGYLILPK